MEFHIITAGRADLVARLVDGQLVIVPPAPPAPAAAPAQPAPEE